MSSEESSSTAGDIKLVSVKPGMETVDMKRVKDEVVKLAMKLEEKRDLSRVIVHIDMDAFFAAVEMRENPDLANIPMAVGGLMMLSTSNYHARTFGVRAAMPGYIAKKLCPHLTIVHPNYEKYIEVSNDVRTVLAEYDDNLCPMSLDESYLDLTSHVEQRLQESKTREDVAGEIVQEIRQKIFLKTNLTCSAGIAVNTRLAKVGSNMQKPNGQFCIPFAKDKILEYVKTLPIGKVSGIGNVTEQQLNALGVKTCGDLWENRGILPLLFSEISTKTFVKISLGLGSSYIECDDPRKSMSVERTFGEMWKPEELQSKCKDLCFMLSKDLKKESMVGKTVTIKLKTVTFHIKTRAKTLPSFTAEVDPIYKAAQGLLEQELKASAPSPLKLRLLGVRMSNLLNANDVSSKQLTLEDIVVHSHQTKFSEVGDSSLIPMLETNDISQEIRVPGANLENNERYTTTEAGNSNDTYKANSASCPICSVALGHLFYDNVAFNKHIDECLNKSKVKEILRECPGTTTPPRKRVLLDKHHSRGKRKKSATRHQTIDRFFKS